MIPPTIRSHERSCLTCAHCRIGAIERGTAPPWIESWCMKWIWAMASSGNEDFCVGVAKSLVCDDWEGKKAEGAP